MNPLTNVKNIQKLNERMLDMGVEDSQAWHKQYKDSAYIFIGGLPYGLTEGDILCVFSQYGEIVNINLVRDKKTGKTKGFCFLCYEDQRSTILAVDNFNGIKLGGRTIRVDHCSNYRRPKSDEKDEDGKYKEIIEEGCAPKTPPPSPPELEKDDEDVLELTRKRKKEKKQKKLSKNMEEKSQKKKKKMTSSDEEEDGEKKEKTDLLKERVQDRRRETERDRHGRIERDALHDHKSHDYKGNSARGGQRDHDFGRDYKDKGDMAYDSKSGHDHERDRHREIELKREYKRDFHERDHLRSERDVPDDRRDKRHSSYHPSRSDKDLMFNERKDRYDKQRDYRQDEGRLYEKRGRNDYGDRKDRR